MLLEPAWVDRPHALSPSDAAAVSAKTSSEFEELAPISDRLRNPGRILSWLADGTLLLVSLVARSGLRHATLRSAGAG